MKGKSTMKKKKWSLRIIVIMAVVMNMVSIQANNAMYTKAEDVKLRGDWEQIQRSLLPDYPITAFTDGSTLHIQNTTPDRDITICVTNMSTGVIEYKATIPAAQTAYIAIPLTHLSAGEYILEITGSPAGQLSGNFTKN